MAAAAGFGAVGVDPQLRLHVRSLAVAERLLLGARILDLHDVPGLKPKTAVHHVIPAIKGFLFALRPIESSNEQTCMQSNKTDDKASSRQLRQILNLVRRCVPMQSNMQDHLKTWHEGVPHTLSIASLCCYMT